MKKYIVEVSETAEKDLENILKYLRYNLAEDIIADKYKLLFKQELKNLEDIAGSMPILSQELTGYKNIRKVNVRNYVIFYITDEENSKAFVLRIGHAFMDWEKYLKDEWLTSSSYLLIILLSKKHRIYRRINHGKRNRFCNT